MTNRHELLLRLCHCLLNVSNHFLICQENFPTVCWSKAQNYTLLVLAYRKLLAMWRNRHSLAQDLPDQQYQETTKQFLRHWCTLNENTFSFKWQTHISYGSSYVNWILKKLLTLLRPRMLAKVGQLRPLLGINNFFMGFQLKNFCDTEK